MGTLYKVQVECCGNGEEGVVQETVYLTYPLEEEAREAIRILKHCVGKSRLGKVSASDWLGYHGPEPEFERDEAILNKLADRIGHYHWVDWVVSLTRVTEEVLPL